MPESMDWLADLLNLIQERLATLERRVEQLELGKGIPSQEKPPAKEKPPKEKSEPKEELPEEPKSEEPSKPSDETNEMPIEHAKELERPFR